MNKFARFVPGRKSFLLALTSAPVLAFAQAVDPFDTAMTESTAAVQNYAGALVGLAAVSVVFMIAIKYVKRIRGAA